MWLFTAKFRMSTKQVICPFIVFIGDHGGSTLLPPNVTNEFPEYGTMEESGKGLETSVELDAESLPCCPQEQVTAALAGQESGFDSVVEGPKDVSEPPSETLPKEQSLQPTDSLITAPKATEIRTTLGTLQATKVLNKDVVSTFSVQSMDKEPEILCQGLQRINKHFPVVQERSSHTTVSAEIMTKESFHPRVHKDISTPLSREAQAKLFQTTNARKALKEPTCSLASVGKPTNSHNTKGNIGVLRDRRCDVERKHSGESLDHSCRVKHVEFQEVKILWTGGENKDICHSVDFETSLEKPTSMENKEFSQVPSHPRSSSVFHNSIGLTENTWDKNWKVPSERPSTSSGTFSPVPLVEGGEDEVFLKESKECIEKKAELDIDKER